MAERVVRDLGLEDEIPVAGLAKRFEEVFVPGRSEPVEIPRGSEALFMLQRIRDEAHRFANTFHGERRSKRMTSSALDGIAGLGETRKKRLVKEFGGVNAVKRADLDTLRALTWLPDSGRRRHPRQVPPECLSRSECQECTCRIPHTRMGRGKRTRRGGSRATPTAPTRSTSSRSNRSPRSSWPGRGGCSTSGAATAS